MYDSDIDIDDIAPTKRIDDSKFDHNSISSDDD
jgi:hypothetical protein